MQKYLEHPLLVPLQPFTPLTPPQLHHTVLPIQSIQPTLTTPLEIPALPTLPPSTPLTKFDMRIWVLVTSFQPLCAYIYNTLYGRRCSTAYDLCVDNLSDSYTHLTNYSVQKKQKFGASTSGGTGVVNDGRSGSAGSVGSGSEDEHELHNTSPATSAKIDTSNTGSGMSGSTSARKLRGVVGTNRSNSASGIAMGGSGSGGGGNESRKRLSETDLLVCKLLCWLL